MLQELKTLARLEAFLFFAGTGGISFVWHDQQCNLETAYILDSLTHVHWWRNYLSSVGRFKQ